VLFVFFVAKPISRSADALPNAAIIAACMTTSVSTAGSAPAFDVAVLGGGPGGYVAAIRAAQLGLKVAVIEREAMGGVCANWGCIPTKVLLRNAEIIELFQDAKTYGVQIDNMRVDYGAAHKRSRDVSTRMVRGVDFLMKKNQVTVITGEGTLVDANTIHVENRSEERTVTASYIIVATGAKPRALPGLVPDGRKIYTYRQLLDVQIVPKTMLVIGSGAIGMEFSYVFHAYGAQVTVLEALPRILPNEDAEVSAEMVRSFNRLGIKTLAGVKVESASVGDDGVTLTVATESGVQTMKADWVLVSAGIIPNTSGIGVDKVGVALDQRGYITVDAHMQTNLPSVYAIGDITGKLGLAHVASAQGVVAAESIAAIMGKYKGHIVKLNYDAIPRCTYTHPQVASMGLTEAQAVEKGYEIKVSKFPFRANGKSLALNNVDGFIKLIADAKYGEILGVHAIGPDVTELLPEFVLAKSAELTPEQIAAAVHAHPTMSEALLEALHGIDGLPIHL
jgi:dihydrolipoamide dehydrogenase